MSESSEQRDKIAREAFFSIAAGLPAVAVVTPLSPAGLRRHQEYFEPFIAAALDRYAEGLREKVLREAAQKMCRSCDHENDVKEKCPGVWMHHAYNHDHGEVADYPCPAGAIHDLIAAMQAEDGGENERVWADLSYSEKVRLAREQPDEFRRIREAAIQTENSEEMNDGE